MKAKTWYLLLISKRYRKLALSGLFDSDWYRATYPDVAAAGIDPLTHYLEYGVKEGRNPSPLFHSSWYRLMNPDVDAAGINPLLHYLQTGAAEGRDPHPLFDSRWYLQQCPDAAERGMNPVRHYMLKGAHEGRDPHPLFDTDWYLAQNPDVAQAGVNPLFHFSSSGGAEGRKPHPLFDTAWYLKQYPDVAADGVNPLQHYINAGAQEGRDPNQYFDTDWYWARYPEAAAKRTNALLDYIEDGAAALRDPHPGFWCKWYLSQNPDVAAAGVEPLAHYLTYGRREGRLPNSIISEHPETILPPAVHEKWRPTEGPDWALSFRRRLQERMSTLAEMNLARPLTAEGPTFSITTTVYDTRPSFVRELADTIRKQAFEDFEWLILDNGSTDRSTVSALEEIAASDRRFKLFSVDKNLHIIGGNRYLFERAGGHFIVPVDSDDVLYPDSLALFANVIRDSGKDLPSLIFSDEHRILEDGEPFDLLWRWEFTFAHAFGTVPAAHLMAFSASVGRQADVYTDDDARGSHDWDTLLRVTERGGRTAHVPEVLYGWRMHESSTAASVGAKDYIENSQSKVLQASLKRKGLEGLFSIRELFGSLGWYHPKRAPIKLPTIELVFILGQSRSNVDNLAHNLGVTAEVTATRRVLSSGSSAAKLRPVQADYAKLDIDWVACNSDEEILANVNSTTGGVFARVIIDSNQRVRDGQGIIDAVGALELDQGAAAVCGPVMSYDGLLLNAGFTAGVGRFVASPFYGWPRGHAPGHLWRVMRRVTASSTCFLAVRADVLSKVGGLSGLDDRDAIHGLDFSVRCAEANYTIVYTPSMVCYRLEPVARSIGEGTPYRARLGMKKALERLETASFSSHLSRSPERFGFLETSNEKSAIGGVDYKPFRPAIPLNLVVDPKLNATPTINLLLPGVRMSSMSGGPNTALNIAYRLGKIGFSLRIISTDLPCEENPDLLIRHMRLLTGIDETLPVEFVSADDRSKPLTIGANDVFMATAWWTAQMTKYASALIGGRPFVYLIQDFEPILYAASSLYVQALETYSLDHIPVINTDFLKEYLTSNGIGKFAEAAFAVKAISFEPSVDRAAFYIQESARPKRRLLFYARPNSAQRNLFEIGVAALRAAINLGILSPINWTFLGMGEEFTPVDLGQGAVLECAPWLGFEDYAEQMRCSDILLSLMASPHPSYPPFEMAACGGLVVTNSYANKSRDRLAAISENIIAAMPTLEGVTACLQEAVARLDNLPQRRRAADIRLPASWDEALADMLPLLSDRLMKLGLPLNDLASRLAMLPAPGSRQPRDSLTNFVDESLSASALIFDAPQQPGLLSFVTTVWNTPPEFMEVLLRSLKEQRGGTQFQWFVLDNGTTDQDTLQFLEKVSRETFVHLERVEANLGIVGGMRYCLERASGRYILPLDSDDYLFPQTVQAVTWFLQKAGFPALLYTDETLLSDTTLHTAYLKPDWDPVLFVNSCYIAHLGVIDRSLALKYDAYGDSRTEGSHDWDTFTRFMLAGHIPVHVPELLYAWRIHHKSTAGNIGSKPFVFDSQHAVLSKFLAAQPRPDLFELGKSPFFKNSPDWWLKRRRIEPTAITTFLVRSEIDGERRKAIGLPADPDYQIPEGIDHRVVEFDVEQPLSEWLPAARQCAAEGRLVHIMAGGVQPHDDEWYWEAVGQLELFPDAVMVGGRLNSHKTILCAGYVFGFDDGCGCPDRGRAGSDPGYFAQMWKGHSANAVSAQHAVVRAEFLLEVLSLTAGLTRSVYYLGQWLGAIASRLGKRVVYSPYVSAETTTDWDGLVSAQEKSDFRESFSDLLTKTPLVSPHLGRTTETAYIPMRDARPSPLIPERGIDAKPLLLPEGQERGPGAPALWRGGVAFSILTTLYSGTDAKLFEKTAESVIRQRYPGFEWCILAHGRISAMLEAVLSRLGREPRIKISRLSDNLGIIGGMRFVLERATGDYIVPLDGDDLLSDGCLTAMARAISRPGRRPAYLYSDEDIVIGSTFSSPYLRPAWDPVLNLENSWIWHATAFQRQAALDLGVYTDPGAEYCHDWDTVSRFVGGGYTPVHVPEILYHWRHHVGSTSNSNSPDQGSARSTHSLMTRSLSERGLSELCEIAPYPIDRGAREWWIRRKPVDLPAIHRVAINRPHPAPAIGAAVTATVGAPYGVPSSKAGLDGLCRLVEGIPNAEIVLLVSSDLDVVEVDIVPEAVKVFECCDDVAIVSGRVLSNDQVVVAGLLFDRDGTLTAPYDGKPISDPGHYALAWKAQCITAPILDLCFVRAGFLKSALKGIPPGCSFSDLALWFGVCAKAAGLRVAYSPLLAGQLRGSVLRKSYGRDDTMIWEVFGRHLAEKGHGHEKSERPILEMSI